MGKSRKLLLVLGLLVLVIFTSAGVRTTRINCGVREAIRPPTFDFEDILADIQWIKTIQFLGTVYQRPGSAPISQEDINRVYSMFERIVEIHPRFTIAYEYGGLALSVCAPEYALSLLERGIENNPDAGWKLTFYAAMVANQWMKDPVKACSFMDKAKEFPDRPAYVDRFFARTASNAGDLRTALEAWKLIYKNAPDELEKNIAARGLNTIADKILEESSDKALKQEAKWIKGSI